MNPRKPIGNKEEMPKRNPRMDDPVLVLEMNDRMPLTKIRFLTYSQEDLIRVQFDKTFNNFVP